MCERKETLKVTLGMKAERLWRRQTHADVSFRTCLKDLLEGELFDGGVGHQVEEDFEGFSRSQGLLRQPEEHVLVQLLVDQQLLLAGLVQADAADAQQGVL